DDQRRDLGEVDDLNPGVDSVARGELRRSQRNVVEPAGIRTSVAQELKVNVEAAEEVEPVTDRIQPWKGNVARAHHQRNEIQSEPQHHRNREEEHHRGSVHREDLVVKVRVQYSVLGNRELQANEERLDATE